MANTTIYNLPALNTVDSTSLFPLSSNVTATPTTYQASIGNIGNAITGNLRMSGDNLSSINEIVAIYGNGTDQATALTLTNSGDAALWANANVTINSNSQGSNPQWIFDTTGNLVLPTGTPSINYANGSPYGGGSGNANTGNVTFDNVNIIGTGNLKLQPDPANSGSYLDIFLTSGPDLHLVASQSANLILGKDGDANVMTSWNGNVYIQSWNQNTAAPNIWMFDGTGNLTAPGYIVLDTGTDGNIDSTGNINIISNVSTWTFGTDGNLTFPGSNLVITPNVTSLGNSAVISSTNHNLITLSTGANGGTSSLWVEDYANAGTSNIAAVYANPTPGSRNVRIAVGLNGSPGPNLWDFDATGNTTFPTDGNVNLGNIAIATHANFVVSAFIGNSSANIFLNYDGSGNFTGNLTSANANLGNLATANYVNVSGNITSGNANLGNIAIANYFSTSGTGGDIALTGGNISGANVLTANTIQLTTIAIANLPAASTPGLKAFVNDSSIPPSGNFGVIVANGGANYTTVFSNGTDWLIG